MALIGNYSVFNKSPGKWGAGNSTAHATGICTGAVPKNRCVFFLPSDWRKFNWVDQSGATFVSLVETAARPRGYYPQGAFALASVAGEMSAYPAGEGTVTANAWAVKLAQAGLTGTGSITSADLTRIVQMVAALVGSGTISSANLQAFLQMAAGLVGSGTVSSAALTALGALLAALTGTGAVSATPSGTGELEADITSTGSALTTANVGAAVWSAIATANDEPGTMGEKLNDAGSASNPWTEVIESGYTAAEILMLIAAATQGDATGLESGNPAFKGLDGTTDRIEATYSSGTRTVTTRNVS